MKNYRFVVCILVLFVYKLAECEILDYMNSLWTINVDSGANASVSISENANQISYDFGEGNWLEIYKDSFVDLDISSGDTVKFYFNDSGNKNHLKLQIYDSDGDVFDRKIEKVTDISQWTEMIVPFSSLSHWEGTGNGSLDTQKISKIAFAVTPCNGGSGNIAVDKIESYQLSTANLFLVSSFNFGTPPNEAGGNEGPMSDGGLYDPVVNYDNKCL